MSISRAIPASQCIPILNLDEEEPVGKRKRVESSLKKKFSAEAAKLIDRLTTGWGLPLGPA